MYTMEITDITDVETYIILDPEGDFVIGGLNKDDAQVLLSHLNRG